MPDISAYFANQLKNLRNKFAPPPPIDRVSQNPLVLNSSRAMATLPQTQGFINQANQAYTQAQPINSVVRNAAQNFPQLNPFQSLANRVQTPVVRPVARFAAPIADYFVNAPGNTFAGALSTGANIADVRSGKKVGAQKALADLGRLGTGLSAGYAPSSIGKLGAVRAGLLTGGAYGVSAGLEGGRDTTLPKQLLGAAGQGAAGAVVGGVLGGVIPPVARLASKTVGRALAGKTLSKGVVQVIDDSGQQLFFRIPEKQSEEINRLIDGTKGGIAGLNIGGKIFHITAKTPAQMLKAGFKEAGVIHPRDIPRTPITNALKKLNNAAKEGKINMGLSIKNVGEPPIPSGELSQSAAKSSPLSKSTPTSMEPKTPGSAMPPGQLPPADTGKIAQIDSSGGNIPQPQDSVNKIIEALKGAKPIRESQQKLYSKELSQRVGALSGVQKNLKPGEAGLYQQLGQLKGALPKAQFEGIRNQLTQDDVNNVFQIVRDSKLQPLQRVNAEVALKKLLGAEGGEVPTRSELLLLNEVFPEEFVKTILDKRSLTKKLFDKGMDALAVPRSLMSSFDVSFPLRQGVFAAPRNPKEFTKAFGTMLKDFVSEKGYQQSLQEIESRPTYSLMKQSKLALTGPSQFFSQREEQFASNLAEKIPGVGKIIRASDRAFSGFASRFRADLFDKIYQDAVQSGVKETSPNIAADISKFVNSATGRGNLAGLERASQALSSVFFSPRLMASRINLLNPVYYMKLDPFVRKEALKTFLTFAGTGLSILGTAKLGGAEVGTDPRSADFGKIKVGNTRYDIWGGFQQYLRATAQLVSGQRVNSETGAVYDLGKGFKSQTRLDILYGFLKSKENPLVSFATDLLQGKDALGQPLNVPARTTELFIPLVIQDMYDLYKDGGVPEMFQGIPAFFGVGTQTYGKQVPNLEQTASGKPTIKLKPVGGIGEDISNMIFNREESNISPEKQQPLVQKLSIEKAQKALKASIKETLADPDLTPEQKKAKVDDLKLNYEKYSKRVIEQTTLPAQKTSQKEGGLIPSASAAESPGISLYYDKNDSPQLLDLTDYLAMPESTKVDKAKKENEAWKIASDISSSKMNDAEKQKVYEQLGLTQEDVNYYATAKEDNDIKIAYVTDELDKVQPAQYMETLAKLRHTVNGEKILADGVIDDLYSNDVITSAQRKYLKSIKDVNGKVTKLKASGPRKAKKLKAAPKVSLRKISIKSPKRIKFKKAKAPTIKSVIKPVKRQKLKALQRPQSIQNLRAQLTKPRL